MGVLHPSSKRKARLPTAGGLRRDGWEYGGRFGRCHPHGPERRECPSPSVCGTGGKHVRNHPNYGVVPTRGSIR